MLAAGDRVPNGRVWRAPNEALELRDLVRDGRALLVFYLFDWSST
jgi:hypothetical protein